MSRFWEALRLALRSMLRSRLRSLLTLLGILIGIAAVVLVVALGEAARGQISAQIQSLGTNLIYVFNGDGGGRSRGVERSGHRLSVDDAEAIRRSVQGLRGVTVYSSRQAQVIGDFDAVRIDVVGADQDYATVRGYDIVSGRDLNLVDVQTKAKVCLIGATAGEKLFGLTDPVGRALRIGHQRFEVVGLLSRKGQTPFGSDQDDRIVMPIGTWATRVFPGHGRRVDMVIASAADAGTVEWVKDQMDVAMLTSHRIPPEGKRDYRVFTQDSFREREEEIYSVLSLVLVSVAGISLFVGGVGVMNILLVSVNERRREIGTRLAVGARRADIRVQFLIEAVTLTLTGGLLGIALSLGGIELIERQFGWHMQLNPGALCLALATSAVLGVAFGLLPAQRAAALDPIEALRQA